jgi:membrane associated rhomboid family serine protease
LHIFELLLADTVGGSHHIGSLQINFLVLRLDEHLVSLQHLFDLNLVHLAFQVYYLLVFRTDLTVKISKLSFSLLVFIVIAFDDQIRLSEFPLDARLLL